METTWGTMLRTWRTANLSFRQNSFFSFYYLRLRASTTNEANSVRNIHSTFLLTIFAGLVSTNKVQLLQNINFHWLAHYQLGRCARLDHEIWFRSTPSLKAKCSFSPRKPVTPQLLSTIIRVSNATHMNRPEWRPPASISTSTFQFSIFFAFIILSPIRAKRGIFRVVYGKYNGTTPHMCALYESSSFWKRFKFRV